MPSLKEIKGRIASVKSTLKITSSMKMVASAKLHKAQQAIGNMRPYEAALHRALSLLPLPEVQPVPGESLPSEATPHRGIRAAVVAFSSNASLCGGFNSNVIKEALRHVGQLESEGYEVTVYSIGKKMSDAMRKAGYPCDSDYNALVGKGGYEDSARFAEKISALYSDGAYSRVDLVYNHFLSTSSQKPMTETYLPLSVREEAEDSDFIFEPGREEIAKALLPKVLKLKIYTVVLDSVASEHAARTLAMQTATDNGETILSDLTLEYNKTRQQKITSEILDLLGGAQ